MPRAVRRGNGLARVRWSGGAGIERCRDATSVGSAEPHPSALLTRRRPIVPRRARPRPRFRLPPATFGHDAGQGGGGDGSHQTRPGLATVTLVGLRSGCLPPATPWARDSETGHGSRHRRARQPCLGWETVTPVRVVALVVPAGHALDGRYRRGLRSRSPVVSPAMPGGRRTPTALCDGTPKARGSSLCSNRFRWGVPSDQHRAPLAWLHRVRWAGPRPDVRR